MPIETSNEEWVTPREIQRAWSYHMARLESGDIGKIVIVKGTTMKAVVLTVEEYERLTSGPAS